MIKSVLLSFAKGLPLMRVRPGASCDYDIVVLWQGGKARNSMAGSWEGWMIWKGDARKGGHNTRSIGVGCFKAYNKCNILESIKVTLKKDPSPNSVLHAHKLFLLLKAPRMPLDDLQSLFSA